MRASGTEGAKHMCADDSSVEHKTLMGSRRGRTASNENKRICADKEEDWTGAGEKRLRADSSEEQKRGTQITVGGANHSIPWHD